jgi:hypothetical protein
MEGFYAAVDTILAQCLFQKFKLVTSLTGVVELCGNLGDGVI